MKTVRVVAAVIKATNDNGEPIIFATQRGYGDFKGGWEFPGGKIEEGETPQEALKREIMEELDTEILVGGDLLKQIQYHRINTKRFRLEKRKSRFSRYLCKVFRGVT